MKNLTVTINNTKLPVKEYQGQRVVTLKEIDTVHDRPEGTARRTFHSNKKHLLEGTDYFVRNPSEAASEFGIIAPNGLVLMTESGYLMLVKSFTDDLAWTVQRQLVNVYFAATASQRQSAAKQTKQQAIKLPPLSSVNMAMKLQADAARAAGVAPEYIQAALSKAYDPYGIAIPSSCLPDSETLYECGEIARSLGVYSKNWEPHSRAISAVISLVGTLEGETKKVPFTVGGYSNATVKYTASVKDRVKDWIEAQNYPSSIQSSDGKRYKVCYKK